MCVLLSATCVMHAVQVRSTSSAETLLMNHIVPDLQLPARLAAPKTADSLAGMRLSVSL